VIALVVFTNGRSTIHRTIASAEANLKGPISERWIHDDSGDPANHEMLRTTYPGYRLIAPDHNLGFGGAIDNAWRTLCHGSDAEFVWHQEDDFTFNREVPLHNFMRILNCAPDLVNLALRRQPVNAYEEQAGGVVECWPKAYEPRWIGEGRTRIDWLEHRLFFTTNPGMYRRELIWQHEWPQCSGSEGAFTQQILQDEEARFGYYGRRDSGEAVCHIGDQRTGTGY
jgi:hypothetical protein